MRRIQSNDVRMFTPNDQVGQQDQQPSNLTPSDKFLTEIFEGMYIPGEPIEDFRQSVRDHRRYMMSTNLHNYQYSRAHHYHFYLDEFPRIPNQASYALDQNNSLKATFSQQDKLYKGDSLGSIVNRVAFTLPKRQLYFDLFTSRKKGHTHNRAHEQLFSVENSKIALDRQLLTCRKILKNIQKLSQNYRLWQFQLIKQHQQLLFLLQQTLDLQQKKQKLEWHIKRLQRQKSATIPVWQANDDMFLYSSFQQKLHDRIEQDEGMQVLETSNRVQFYISKHRRLVQALGKPETDLDSIFTRIFTYHHTKVLAISLAQIQRLKAHVQKINKPSKTTLPLLIFNFGSFELREKVNQIIAAYVKQKQLQTKDQLIYILRKLFRGNFQNDQQSEELSSYQAKIATKAERINIKRCLQLNKEKVNQPYLLDESINEKVLEESVTAREEALPIFNHSDYKIPLFLQQTQTLFYYNAICKTITLFQPSIHQHTNLINILCSPYLDVLLHGIIGHFPNKDIGKLSNNLKHLVQHSILSSLVQQTEVSCNFYWEFNQESGIGLLWDLPKKPCQGKNLSHFYSILLSKKSSQQKQSQVGQDEKQQECQPPVRKIIKQNEEES